MTILSTCVSKTAEAGDIISFQFKKKDLTGVYSCRLNETHVKVIFKTSQYLTKQALMLFQKTLLPCVPVKHRHLAAMAAAFVILKRKASVTPSYRKHTICPKHYNLCCHMEMFVIGVRNTLFDNIKNDV
jgi:hypothetical protein